VKKCRRSKNRTSQNVYCSYFVLFRR